MEFRGTGQGKALVGRGGDFPGADLERMDSWATGPSQGQEGQEAPPYLLRSWAQPGLQL